MTKVTIICSPVSGAKKGKEIVETKLLPSLRALGVDAVAVYTEHAGHAVSLAAKHGNKDMAIIAVGGDGTTNEVLQGLLESGKLGETSIGVLSQGTMNFFGVCAGLPSVDGLPKYVAEGTTRPCSLMRITNGIAPAVSFEAAHIGLMAHKVCKGAQDWRFSLGPMFGIFLHLIMGNLFPKANCQRGTLTLWPSDGSSPVHVEDQFFWIICTHRNPYTGAVGRDMWVSWMTLDSFPGFPRMMAFFEPPMEHFGGTKYCFGHHLRALRVEFTLADSDPSPAVAPVLDGDHKPAKRTVVIEHLDAAWRVFANPEFPTSVDPSKVAPKPLTKAAAKWLIKFPPPSGVKLLPPKDESPVPAKQSDYSKARTLAALVIGILVWRAWRSRAM